MKDDETTHAERIEVDRILSTLVEIVESGVLPADEVVVLQLKNLGFSRNKTTLRIIEGLEIILE